MRVLFISLIFGVFVNNAHAEGQLTVFPGLMYFDYEERADDGSFLDGETGPVLGVTVNFEYIYPSSISTSFHGGIYTGSVDYDGHAQPSGTPVKTNTIANYFNLGIRTNFPLVDSKVKADLSVGYEMSRWERDIQPTISPLIGFVSGLYEIYQWEEISLGTEFSLRSTVFRQWNFYAGVFQTRDPDIIINLEADGDGKPQLFMGTDTGMEFSAQWMRLIKKALDVGVRLTYKTWRFGRSNSLPISGGRQISEPKSRTRLIFLELVVPM